MSADVAELADALDLGSSSARSVGSSPSVRIFCLGLRSRLTEPPFCLESMGKATMGWTRHNLVLPTLQLSYLEWSQGQEPLLLLHGLTDQAQVWSSLGDFLAGRYHVIAPDLRGHGESDKPAQGYTFAEVIADLEALMTHLGWTSAHMLGHSWTGKLLPIWARQHPERFRSMMLVDPFFIGKMPEVIRLTFPWLYRVLPFLKVMGPFASRAEAERQGRQLKQYRAWSRLQQEVFWAGMEQKADGRWGSKFTLQTVEGVFLDVMRVAGLTQAIAIPTLLIQPEKGLNRTHWQLQPYKTYLTQLQIRSVPGNHWAFLVEPAAFNQAIAEFLHQFSSAPSSPQFAAGAEEA